MFAFISTFIFKALLSFTKTCTVYSEINEESVCPAPPPYVTTAFIQISLDKIYLENLYIKTVYFPEVGFNVDLV